MQHTFLKTGIALATALVTSLASAGGPTYVFEEGGAVLTFERDALAALNTAGVSVSAVAPATFDGSKITLGATDDLVVWDAQYDLKSLTGLGGFQLSSTTTPGARVDLTNVMLETTGTVYADVVTQSYTSPFGNYEGRTVERMALFNGALTGQTNIEAGNLTTNATVSNLILTSQAIPTLGDALGVPGFIQLALFPTLNFGKVELQGTFAPAVPEPSTIALNAVGLLAMVAVLRGRRRVAAT